MANPGILPGALGGFLEHVTFLARVLVPVPGPQADRKITLKRLSAGGQPPKRYFGPLKSYFGPLKSYFGPLQRTENNS